MKVAMIARGTLYSNPGGDTVQIKNTAKYLRHISVQADIKLTNQPVDYGDYDLLHFFNIIRPADILRHLVKDKPFVVSPVFVDYSEYENKQRQGLAGYAARLMSPSQQEFTKAIARHLLNGEKIRGSEYILRGHKNSITRILKDAAMLLPNSESEYRRLIESYDIATPFAVIPNAIDDEIFFKRETQKDDSLVICAGRIEGLKNQLNLIRALNGTQFKLMIIGNSAANHSSYYRQCKKEAESNVAFRDAMNQTELTDYYARAKVHVLPSWFETTGLSSLEAAAMGCNIVVTRKGDTCEYFGEDAFYCEPHDILSIRQAVESAADSSVNQSLIEKIKTSYTWKNTAELTKAAYEKALHITAQSAL